MLTIALFAVVVLVPVFCMFASLFTIILVTRVPVPRTVDFIFPFQVTVPLQEPYVVLKPALVAPISNGDALVSPNCTVGVVVALYLMPFVVLVPLITSVIGELFGFTTVSLESFLIAVNPVKLSKMI